MCDFCKMIYGGHSSSCPLYISNGKTKCVICAENISQGEEYIYNTLGECAHFDCFFTKRSILDFLGYEIKIMEED